MDGSFHLPLDWWAESRWGDLSKRSSGNLLPVFPPLTQSPSRCSALEHCLEAVLEWMRDNRLTLNLGKTEGLWVEAPNVSNLGTLGGTLSARDEVRSLMCFGTWPYLCSPKWHLWSVPPTSTLGGSPRCVPTMTSLPSPTWPMQW